MGFLIPNNTYYIQALKVGSEIHNRFPGLLLIFRDKLSVNWAIVRFNRLISKVDTQHFHLTKTFARLGSRTTSIGGLPWKNIMYCN